MFPMPISRHCRDCILHSIRVPLQEKLGVGGGNSVAPTDYGAAWRKPREIN